MQSRGGRGHLLELNPARRQAVIILVGAWGAQELTDCRLSMSGQYNRTVQPSNGLDSYSPRVSGVRRPEGLALGLRAHRVRLAFLNTAPLTDVHLLIALAPLFWVVGVEQFAAPTILAWSAIKYFLRGKRVALGIPGLLLGMLVISMLVSATGIDSAIRSITFMRSLAMYLMGILVGVIISGDCDTPLKVRLLLRTVVHTLAFTAALALLGIIGLTDLRFRSVAGYVLPSVLADTGYGNQIVWRSLGNPSWFQGLGNYFRVSGIFLFSTMWAAATAITLPIAVYFVASTRRVARFVYVVAAFLIAVGLIYSTGRVAWLAISVAAVVVGASALRPGPRTITLLLAATMAVAAFLVVPTEVWIGATEGTVYARGAGSTTSRLTIYEATFEGVLERPLLGWGTERDITTVENFDLPAGSHSYYLGFLYKYGAVGLSILLAFMMIVARSVWLPSRGKRYDASPRSILVLLRFLSWSLLTAALIGLTSALDLDTNLMLIVWVVLFCALRLKRLAGYSSAGLKATDMERL